MVLFLTVSLMSIFGMPLHFVFGLIGYRGIPLQAISASIWLSNLILLTLFLTRRLSLEKSFFWRAVLYQFFESVRIVYLAAMAQQGWLEAHQMLMLINEILSLCNLIVICMGLVPLAPTVVFILFFVSMGVAYAICPEVMLSQFVMLIFFGMTGIWLYSLMVQRLVNSTSLEISNYKQFQGGTKRAGEMDKGVLSHLSEHTRHNLIALGAYLKNEQRDRTLDLSAVFPQLTPAELEVARLILKNMSLKEIAVATGKSLSNVGTVRGNIRKKLGLDPKDDLREWLLEKVNS